MTNGTEAPADGVNPAATGAAPGKTPNGAKSIILFSDGTGNSSAKLFKTNVFRMYEAVDLGPSTEGKRDQISYYDDGVGTSSFTPLAVLGGAFGWGLKRNVLDIYRFACRNYREGDDIYAFGFSRGAFTARIVVALIAKEGLVRSDDEAELNRKTREAYRSFRADFLPRRLQWPTRLSRRVRSVIGGWIGGLKGHKPYDRADNCCPTIRFVGVWDTVSAYGGPITEITRAIDNWIYPLSMPDYQLNERVQWARHALAIDDERDAFHPLVWDEVHEQALVDAGKVSRERLEQVWFTGMHADVGGGYPDESLSYVSLLWMMEEAEWACERARRSDNDAERSGLRTLKVIKDRFVALASSYGPIHDSRAGLAAYYRYQPRRIAAWLDPVDEKTLSLRDPAIADEGGRPRGLLRSVNVHESVINRIATGTDRYAPITLPQVFRIVPPQKEGETVLQADSQTPNPPSPPNLQKPMVSRALREQLESPAAAIPRARAIEPILNLVWWRRLTYFATLAATLMTLGLPLVVAKLPNPPFLADGRTWIGGIIRLLTLVLPSFAGKWVEVYANNPFYFLLLAVVIVVFLTIGTGLERTLRDEARRVWKGTIEGALTAEPRASWVQKFRNSPYYQRFVQLFKWYFLPDWVVAPLIVVLASWLGLAVYAQSALPFLENGRSLCQPSPGGVAEITSVWRDFHTRDVCSGSFGQVVEKKSYIVTFDVVEPWFDSSIATTPEGIRVGDFPLGLGYLAAPFRRVIDARYLQPVLEVRPTDGEHRIGGNAQIYPLTVRPVGNSEILYRAEFVAPRTGELFLFANDAMIPLAGKYDYRYFYERSGPDKQQAGGNRGSACVTVERVDVTDKPKGAPPAGSICERAARRDAAQPAAVRAQGPRPGKGLTASAGDAGSRLR
jgi:uncharacterized protein (DUF2235 family)